METQLLTKEFLEAYGFKQIEKKTKDRVTVMSKGLFELAIVDDGSVFYSNQGFDYPLKDLAALKKLYKEVRREELTAG